jgi:hypothetical protein
LPDIQSGQSFSHGIEGRANALDAVGCVEPSGLAHLSRAGDAIDCTRNGSPRRSAKRCNKVNAKCAIIKACRHDPLVQRAYAECAEGYSFKIDAYPPHDPQKKGIVESGVKYLKSNFLPTRSFRDLADLNAQARAWVMTEAGTRVHGTTRQQPLVLFDTERALLQALPAVAPDLGTWHRVVLHRDCHVMHDKALYSAPFTLVGKTLWLRATDTVVALYEDYRHLYTHARAQRPGERKTLPDHLPPHARAYFERDRNWCAVQAQAVGPHCADLVSRLLGDRVAERLRAAQGVLSFAKRYGNTRLEAACARALAHAHAGRVQRCAGGFQTRSIRRWRQARHYQPKPGGRAYDVDPSRAGVARRWSALVDDGTLD